MHEGIFLFNSRSLISSLLLEIFCACFHLPFSSPFSFHLLIFFITSFIFICVFTYLKVRTDLCILVIQTSNLC